MRFEKLEKTINKLDKDIEALRRSKNYLSNIDEINEIMDVLNQERQVYANELYAEDSIVYYECIEEIKNLINKQLGKDEQIKLLDYLKENEYDYVIIIYNPSVFKRSTYYVSFRFEAPEE